jgi:hypothetical protein
MHLPKPRLGKDVCTYIGEEFTLRKNIPQTNVNQAVELINCDVAGSPNMAHLIPA